MVSRTVLERELITGVQSRLLQPPASDNPGWSINMEGRRTHILNCSVCIHYIPLQSMTNIGSINCMGLMPLLAEISWRTRAPSRQHWQVTNPGNGIFVP